VPGTGRRPRVAGARRPVVAPPAAEPEVREQLPPEPAPTAEDELLLVVGRIGKPQGIRGEVTVQVRTDDPQARFAVGARLLTDPAERGPLTVAAARDQNGRLMVLFEGVPDRNAAEALRGTLVLVDAAQLPAPDDPDEFHDFQLVGLAAELPDGAPLGTVVEVLHLPHGDVLAVRRAGAPGGAAEVLVPFVAAMVPVVDVPGGRIVVHPPDGLLDLSEPTPDGDLPDGDLPDGDGG
jgi:16S rRNA processing protein RimM